MIRIALYIYDIYDIYDIYIYDIYDIYIYLVEVFGHFRLLPQKTQLTRVF